MASGFVGGRVSRVNPASARISASSFAIPRFRNASTVAARAIFTPLWSLLPRPRAPRPRPRRRRGPPAPPAAPPAGGSPRGVPRGGSGRAAAGGGAREGEGGRLLWGAGEG